MRLSTVYSAVLALASLSSTTAIPTLGWGRGQPQPKPYVEPNLTKLAKFMPKSALPAPDGLKLKFVGLGIGTQNYTCGSNATAEPGTTGALAKLYNIGDRLNSEWDPSWKINTLSGMALGFYKTPKMLDGFLMSQGYQNVLGDHFFTQATPTFSLWKIKANPFPLAFVKKSGFVDAPVGSCPGTKNEGAIQWLYLTDNGSSQGGVNTVYRLVTAGGNKPKTCEGQKPHWEVPYTAQYWIYGS